METPQIYNFNHLFHLSCIIATVGIASWCCYKYSLNDDFTIINFKRFNSDERSIYPSLSLCWSYPCLDDKLGKLAINITCLDYYNMVDGLNFNEKILDIDYDNFTIQLENYLLGTQVVLRNGSTLTYESSTHNGSNYLNPPYRGFTEISYKCYTFDTSYIERNIIREFRIHLKPSCPSLNGSEIAVHYPNQLMRGNLQLKALASELDLKRNLTESNINVQITGVTTLYRRNKPKAECNEDWKRDDLLLLEKVATSVNCKHPYINVSHNLTPCSNISEINRFKWDNITNDIPPCIEVKNVNFGLSWGEAHSEDDTRITISIRFLLEKYQEISQVRNMKFSS